MQQFRNARQPAHARCHVGRNSAAVYRARRETGSAAPPPENRPDADVCD